MKAASSHGRGEMAVKVTGIRSPRSEDRQQGGVHGWSPLAYRAEEQKAALFFSFKGTVTPVSWFAAVNENQVKANEPVINKSISSFPKLNNELKEIYSIHLKKLFTFPVATCY